MPSLKRTVRVVREWSIKDADYRYATYIRTQWKDDVYTTSKHGEGDLAWATTNAEHFQVDITDLDLSDDWMDAL